MRNAPKINGRLLAGIFLMPGVVPRLRELFQGGFSFIAVALAYVYRAVRLLPAGHPYLNPANAGRFGIRHVVGAAAANLVYKRENIDQIFVFYVLLGGLGILVLQFALMVGTLFGHAAHAATMPTSFEGFFGTPNATNDVAFVLLDRVFGVPDLFLDNAGNPTCVEANQPCFTTFNPNTNAEGAYPWPFHTALHAMLQFYSIGLLVVAALIFCYYIFAVAAETAQTGTPFGRRFNHVWAPIRLVAAFGLLIPIANGLNGAQYVLLYAAKWGSGFATNGWNLFTSQLTGSTLAGDQQSLIAAPNSPDVTKLMEFFSVAEACRAYYQEEIGSTPGTTNSQQIVRAYLVHDTTDATPRMELEDSTSYDDALQFYNNQDIHIVFGVCLAKGAATAEGGGGGSGNTVDCDSVTGNEVYNKDKGYVKPVCGELVMPVSGAISSSTNPGAYAIQQGFFELIRDTWLGGQGGDDGTPDPDAACATTTTGDYKEWLRHWGYCWVEMYAVPGGQQTGVVPPDEGDLEKLMNGGAEDDQDPVDGYDYAVQQIIDQGVTAERAADEWGFGMQDLGWAGAGIWYNKIAQMNGALITAASNVPRVVKYPEAMVSTAEARLKNDKNAKAREIYQPAVSTGNVQLPGEGTGAAKEATEEDVLWPAFHVWDPMYPQNATGGSVFDQVITAVFGQHNLFNMRTNANISPIALLAGLGDSLINGTVTAFGLGGLSTIASGLFDPSQGGFFSAAGSILNTLGVTLLTTGFILYYVVPFLPFLYFFFAVGSWVKGIFEAMVGVPLWALAHIRIDGEGLAGSAAMGGYFMLFEIFLRPILIIFGMLASILLFSAQVFVLNDIWDLVTSNLTGYSHADAPTDSSVGAVQWMRDQMDQFFFTVIYAFVVYMLGTSSFKLITFLPQRIMRWMGSGVGAFTDQEADPGEGLTGRIQATGAVASNITQQGFQGLSSSARGLAQGLGLKSGGQ